MNVIHKGRNTKQRTVMKGVRISAYVGSIPVGDTGNALERIQVSVFDDAGDLVSVDLLKGEALHLAQELLGCCNAP